MRRLLLMLSGLLALTGAALAEPRWLTLPPTPTLPEASQSGYAEVNGIRIWYAVFGKGRPVLLVHGEEDPLIPAMALHQAANTLAAAGAEVEWHLRPGLAHGIDMEGLELGGAFLGRILTS